MSSSQDRFEEVVSLCAVRAIKCGMYIRVQRMCFWHVHTLCYTLLELVKKKVDQSTAKPSFSFNMNFFYSTVTRRMIEYTNILEFVFVAITATTQNNQI